MTALAEKCAGLLDGPALAAFLTATGTPTTPAQIRKWASRGSVQRHGRDADGRTLYDVAEVARRARRDGRRTAAA